MRIFYKIDKVQKIMCSHNATTQAILWVMQLHLFMAETTEDASHYVLIFATEALH